jgi:sRNA-binding regulator protein Hfq
LEEYFMSNADDLVYSRNPSLLTLKGQVTIHFLDGDVVEGDFATQDEFNIFLTVGGEPMMVPRSQIRFIKGRQGQQIEEDTSQSDFFDARPVPEEMDDTYQDALLEVEPTPIEKVDTLGARAEEEFAVPSQFPEDEDEGTIILNVGEVDEDDGTLVLYPDTDQMPAGYDDNNGGTFILETPEAPFSEIEGTEEEDLDMTVLLDELDEEPVEPDSLEKDATMVLDEQELPKITASLTCTSGPHSGAVLQLTGGIITLGRSSDNTLALSNDKEISRHHAIILQESGKFVIQDQNSLNGTFVNDNKITAPRYLKDGDNILVGLSTFRYQEA